jgi:tight adherence protein B
MVLALVIGLQVAAAAFVVRRGLRIRRMHHNVESALGHPARDLAKDKEAAGRLGSPLLGRTMAATEQTLGDTKMWQFLSKSIERSAVRLRVVELVYLSFAVAFALALIVAFRGSPTIVILGAFVLGAVVAPTVVYVLGERRVRAFDAQLPDILSTIAASLRAGHGLKHALQAIGDEAAEPAATEFKRVISEARLGLPLEEAMITMCERLGSADLEYVASAVSVQSMVGGSMAGLFDQAAETVRHRQQHARKLKSLTATGRASATVLTLLPIGLAAFMTLVNPEYMLPFFRAGSGQVIVVICLVSIAIGALFLVRVVSVKE